MDARIEGFPPVVNADARILILGSMPSVKSLEEGFYYGHPRNAFWQILADFTGEARPGTIPAKASLLTRHGFALWDVLHACEREGSLDSAIRSPEANDFEGFFREHPGIERILFNGAAAEKLYTTHVGALPEGVRARRMPSTSPAYTLPYDRKLILWRKGLMLDDAEADGSR